eukprot:scaffold1244_cov162-Ochromonas_danica.AAC.17
MGLRPTRSAFRPLEKSFHSSGRAESALIVGGAAMLGAAVTIRYAIAAYETYKQSLPQTPPEEPYAASKETADEPVQKAQAKTQAKAKEDASPSAFSSWFARNYYDGGFEEKMSRREAALILGVRETATVERIKEAHRRVLLINHPDRGGSAFLSAKINEAKDLLLKGRE